MRKGLILIGILVLILAGVAFWLGESAKSAAPEPGEVRLEIEDAL